MWTLLVVYATLSDTDGATSPGTNQTCRDVDSHCEKYDNICAPNVRNWAQQYCAKYCGLCTATTAPSTTSTTQRMTSGTTSSTTSRTTVAANPCDDLYLGSCVAAFGGRCKEPLVSQLCQKTCGVCKATTKQSTTSTTERTTVRTTPRTTTSTTLRTTTAAAACKDLYLGSCKQDLSGDCGDQFVATVCKKSCDLCHDASTTPPTTSTTSTTTTSSAGTTTMNRIQAAFCANKSTINCPTDLEPICGTNGYFYLNECEFFKVQCDDHSLVSAPQSHCIG